MLAREAPQVGGACLSHGIELLLHRSKHPRRAATGLQQGPITLVDERALLWRAAEGAVDAYREREARGQTSR